MITDKILTLHINIPSEREKICAVGRALSVPDRVRILNLLTARSMNLNEISKVLDIPVSSVSNHINALQDAELVLVSYQPSAKGHVKLCSEMVCMVQIKRATPCHAQNFGQRRILHGDARRHVHRLRHQSSVRNGKRGKTAFCARLAGVLLSARAQRCRVGVVFARVCQLHVPVFLARSQTCQRNQLLVGVVFGGGVLSQRVAQRHYLSDKRRRSVDVHMPGRLWGQARSIHAGVLAGVQFAIRAAEKDYGQQKRRIH